MNIIQSNEYYAHGLPTANSWTRDNAVANNFLANGATELNATTQVYDLDFRNYDPILGRMNQVDPAASKYSSASPYHFSFNNPVGFTDPSGADPFYGPGPGDLWDNQHVNNDVAARSNGGPGNVKPDGYGGYYNDNNGNDVQDAGEEAANGWYRTTTTYQITHSLDGQIISSYQQDEVEYTGYINPDNYVYSGILTQGGPIVKLISGSIDGFIANAKFSVEGVKADGIRIIQTVIGKNYLGDGQPPGKMTWKSGNDVFYAFVDGGVNSPSGGVTPGLPFYPAANLFDPDSGVGVISFHDEPTAGLFWWSLSFETSIVATNYNGTGVDQVLASFQWGYDSMRSTTSVISLQPGISAQSAAIINYDYPNYRFK